VVVDEVRELAIAVNRLAAQIKGRIASIGAALRNTHTLLTEVSTVHMSEEDLLAYSRIKTVMHWVVEQNAQYAGALKQRAETTEKIEADVSAVIVGMQFGDRAKQYLENVCGAMEAIAASTGDLSALLPMADGVSLGCAESHQGLKLSSLNARCTR
jgi:methyl-accepting chemotaxis protein